MHQHLATLTWTTSELARRTTAPAIFIHPVRKSPVPPPWPDEAWSLICRFPHDAPLTSTSPVTIRFLVREAPHEWLVPGVHLYLFEGPTLVATLSVGEPVTSSPPPQSGWRTQIASDVQADSLSFEVLDQRDQLVAEVQRFDTTHDVRLFIPSGFAPGYRDWLITEAELQLGSFEDGTLLPPASAWRTDAT